MSFLAQELERAKEAAQQKCTVLNVENLSVYQKSGRSRSFYIERSPWGKASKVFSSSKNFTHARTEHFLGS